MRTHWLLVVALGVVNACGSSADNPGGGTGGNAGAEPEAEAGTGGAVVEAGAGGAPAEEAGAGGATVEAGGGGADAGMPLGSPCTEDRACVDGCCIQLPEKASPSCAPDYYCASRSDAGLDAAGE